MQPFKYRNRVNNGNLRHRITIQRYVVEVDELGQETEGEWQDFKKLWADIKTMQGREYFAAAATQAENTSRFIVRYTPDITHDMRVKYDGRIYDIVQPPINDNELNETLTIIAKDKE